MSFAAHRLAHRVPFQQLILTLLVTVMEYPLSKIITPRPRGTEICSLFIGSREKDSLLGQRFSIFSVLFSTCSLPNKAFWKIGRDGWTWRGMWEPTQRLTDISDPTSQQQGETIRQISPVPLVFFGMQIICMKLAGNRHCWLFSGL